MNCSCSCCCTYTSKEVEYGAVTKSKLFLLFYRVSFFLDWLNRLIEHSCLLASVKSKVNMRDVKPKKTCVFTFSGWRATASHKQAPEKNQVSRSWHTSGARYLDQIRTDGERFSGEVWELPVWTQRNHCTTGPNKVSLNAYPKRHSTSISRHKVPEFMQCREVKH